MTELKSVLLASKHPYLHAKLTDYLSKKNIEVIVERDEFEFIWWLKNIEKEEKKKKGEIESTLIAYDDHFFKAYFTHKIYNLIKEIGLGYLNLETTDSGKDLYYNIDKKIEKLKRKYFNVE